MSNRILATPTLKGEDAIRVIKAINRTPSEKAKKGAELLKKQFEGVIKQ